MSQVVDIDFCKRPKCCPSVQFSPDRRLVSIGEKGNYFHMAVEEFQDFIKAAKEGKFDAIH